MGQEETNEREIREERYRVSQDDISIIRKELNKLTAAVGDMVGALKGNDFGSEGLLNRVSKMEEMAEKLKDRLDELSITAKKRENQLLLLFTLIGALVGACGKWFMDYISSKK